MDLSVLQSIASLVGTLAAHPLLFAILFSILFGGMVVLLAGRQAVAFLLGLMRAVASCFYSPILWLRKAILNTADFATRDETLETRGDQYLLNRILIIARAVLIVFAVGGLAAGLAVSGTALIPAKQVRQQLSALSSELKQREAAFKQAARAQEQVEKRWDSVRADKLEEFRDAASGRLSAARGRMDEHSHALEKAVWFGDLREELASVQPTNDPSRFVQARAAADRRIRNLYSWDAGLLQHAHEYVSAWYDAAMAEHVLKTPAEDVRQALLSSLEPETAQARERVEEASGELKAAQAAAGAGIVRAVLRAAGSVLTFLATLWLFGLIVEWVWLFIRLADNVRVLREREAVPGERDAVRS